MSDFRMYVDRQLQDPDSKDEYDRTRAEFEITRVQIAARIS